MSEHDMPDFPPFDYHDVDFYMPDDPYPDHYMDTMPDDPFDHWQPPDDPTPAPADDLSLTDQAWRWQDTRLIGIERDQPERYEIGAIDLYTNINTGETAGLYLPIVQFEDEEQAIARFQQLDDELATQAPDQQIAFVEAQAHAHQPDPSNWRDATETEYHAYDHLIGQQLDDDTALLVDEPSFDGPSLDDASPQQTAIGEIGLKLAHADLDPPMFTDDASNTQYWIGVFQPDMENKETGITSILSLTADDAGNYHAQLAPCAIGDLETAYNNAHFLMEKAQQGGMDYAFDAAEAMARGSQQRDNWHNERGIPMEID